MTSLRAAVTGAVVLAVVAASFVATSWVLARGGTDEGRAVPFSAPTMTSRDLVAPSAEGDSVPRALTLGTLLTAEVGRARAACMSEQGYDQHLEATRARRAPARPELLDQLSILPVEFGPSTRAEARRYGFAGVSVALDEGEVGAVVSRDATFDRLAERCDRWLYGEVAPGLPSLQTRAARLTEEVDNTFHDEVVRRLDGPIERRLACVRRAYPRLPSWRSIQSTSEGELLSLLGIAEGRVRPGAGPDPSAEQVRPGTVRVFPPPAADTYVATPDEVRFASVYADCGEATDFTDELARAVVRARASIESRYAARADRLCDDVAANLRRLEVEVVAEP